jgi:hypothetical protein
MLTCLFFSFSFFSFLFLRFLVEALSWKVKSALIILAFLSACDFVAESPINVACSPETWVQRALGLIVNYGLEVVAHVSVWHTRRATVYAVRTFVESLGGQPGQPSALTAAELILFPRSPSFFLFVVLFN